MKIKQAFLLVLLVILSGGFLIVLQQTNIQPTTQVTADTIQPIDSSVLIEQTNYLEYSDDRLRIAQIRGKSVLFFAATGWCQSCSDLDKEIGQRVQEIPADVTILKVDYDNDKIMNDRYSVARQHTLIILDEQGQEIKRWVGGDFDELLSELM